jgi:hypothetical protein
MLLSDLIISPNNPQIFGDLKGLENSLKRNPKFLTKNRIKYDPETMHILSGNKRVICLRNLGYDKIPNEWVESITKEEFNDQEKKEFVVTENTLYGEHDFVMLKENYTFDFLSDIGVVSNQEFEPMIHPELGSKEVTQEDIDKTNQRMQSIKDKPSLRTVICPNCMEEFQID